MQNLITANSTNITLEDAAIGLGNGNSSNFSTKVPSASENSEKFNKIFEDTTRRQNNTATSNSNKEATTGTNDKKIKQQTPTVTPKTETAKQDTVVTADATVVESEEKPAVDATIAGTEETTQESQTAPIVEEKTEDELEIPKTAAILDNIIQVANDILIIPEVQAEPELVGKINELLNEVKNPEILTTQDLEKIQKDFEVVVDEAKNLTAQGQSQGDETADSETNIKQSVRFTPIDTEEQQTLTQGQNTVQVEGEEKPETVAPETTKHKKNQTHAEHIQTKGHTMEMPKEAVSNIKADTLFVSEDNIVDENGEIVKVETRNKEQAAEVKTIDANIISELDASVEQVVVAPQTQTKDSKSNTLKNALSASEHIIKLSIEDIAPKADMAMQDNTSNDLLNNGKQDFNSEIFKLNLNTATRGNVANTSPMTFDEAIKNDVLNQIGAKFEQLQQGSPTGKITLALRPMELGRVVIELTQNANGVTTNIIAHNSSVKELLEKNIDSLKQQLAQAGVNVQNINVKTTDSGDNSEQKDHTEHNKEEKQEQKGKNSEQRNNKNNEKEEG